MEKNDILDDTCFCCGKANEKGLHLRFSYPGEGKSEVAFKVPDYFSGWRSVTHGGFLSMLLDEAMAHACRSEASMAVTGELSVKFQKPVQVGETIRIEGIVKEVRSRIIYTSGIIWNEKGEKAAEGKAKFLITSR